MINYIINREEKTIELLSGSANIQEIKDLIKMFKDYKFTVAIQKLPELPKVETQRQGMLVGAAYVPIISTIEHH